MLIVALSVTYKPFMLFVIMLNVVMLNVVMPSVVAQKEFTSCRYETSFQVDVSRRRSHFVEFYDAFLAAPRHSAKRHLAEWEYAESWFRLFC
jgi:hypothetical protein